MRCHWCQAPLADYRAARAHVCSRGPRFVGIEGEAAPEQPEHECEWQAQVQGDVVIVVSRSPARRCNPTGTLRPTDRRYRAMRDLLALQSAGVLYAALTPGGMVKAVDHGPVEYHGAVGLWYLSEFHIRVGKQEQLHEPQKALEPAAIDRVEG